MILDSIELRLLSAISQGCAKRAYDQMVGIVDEE